MNKLSFIFLWLFPLILQSQTGSWEWVKNNPGGIDNCVATFGSNVFLLKTKGSYPGEYDTVRMEKYGRDGSFKWRKIIAFGRNVTPVKMIIDSGGNFYITGTWGYYASLKPFDSLYTGDLKLALKGNTDVFLIKYDSSGLPLWAKAIGGNKQEISGYQSVIYFDSGRNLYISIESMSDSMVVDTFRLHNFYGIMKFNFEGRLLQVKNQWNIPSIYVQDHIYSGLNDNFYKFSTGFLADTILKIDNGRSDPFFMLASRDNKIIFAAKYYKTSVLNGHSLPFKGGYDSYIGNYDTNGSLNWFNAWGGSGNDKINYGSVDNSGHILLACEPEADTVYFFDGKSMITHGQFMVLLDSNGQVVFKQDLPGLKIRDICSGLDGDFYATFSYKDSAVFNSATVFKGKGGCLARFSLKLTSIMGNAVNENINVYPNPVINNCIFIDYRENGSEGLHFELVDISGKKVLNGRLDSRNSSGTYRIEISENLKGIFFLKLYSEKNRMEYVKKVVVF